MLDFPMHQQISTQTSPKLDSGIAQEAATLMGKVRPFEKAYLHQLLVMQIVRKHRHNCRAVFGVDLEALDW